MALCEMFRVESINQLENFAFNIAGFVHLSQNIQFILVLQISRNYFFGVGR